MWVASWYSGCSQYLACSDLEIGIFAVIITPTKQLWYFYLSQTIISHAVDIKMTLISVGKTVQLRRDGLGEVRLHFSEWVSKVRALQSNRITETENSWVCCHGSVENDGKWVYLKGNYYWREAFLTSMMGGSVHFQCLIWSYQKLPAPKSQRIVFQPSIFRGELLL